MLWIHDHVLAQCLFVGALDSSAHLADLTQLGHACFLKFLVDGRLVLGDAEGIR